MPKVLSYAETDKWINQIADEAVDWAKIQGKHTQEELSAYRMGIIKGARDIINTLQLHGHLANYHHGPTKKS